MVQPVPPVGLCAPANPKLHGTWACRGTINYERPQKGIFLSCSRPSTTLAIGLVDWNLIATLFLAKNRRPMPWMWASHKVTGRLPDKQCAVCKGRVYVWAESTMLMYYVVCRVLIA
jgi:hypothetical protein|mmetsp:Transcript_36965/g.60295  ORF Transcript_36965/g.60295 Transcript_36965/m.60295 type:complete len:116 (-) Transcript_36965:222-569(-)